jgi:hypothetical protein
VGMLKGGVVEIKAVDIDAYPGFSHSGGSCRASGYGYAITIRNIQSGLSSVFAVFIWMSEIAQIRPAPRPPWIDYKLDCLKQKIIPVAQPSLDLPSYFTPHEVLSEPAFPVGR